MYYHKPYTQVPHWGLIHIIKLEILNNSGQEYSLFCDVLGWGEGGHLDLPALKIVCVCVNLLQRTFVNYVLVT